MAALIPSMSWLPHRGHTNRKVGELLFISPKTVGRHMENIYARIEVSTRAGATVYVMAHRLLG
jgi:DNA-binding NarL/FixJ family response regulator